MRKYAGSNIVQLLIGKFKSRNENLNSSTTGYCVMYVVAVLIQVVKRFGFACS